jgi:hypothetical protein
MFTSRKMCLSSKATIQMTYKVFDMVLLRYLHIIYIDRWARVSSCSECHIDQLSLINLGLSNKKILILLARTVTVFVALRSNESLRGARVSSCSDGHMDRLSLISFNSPIT